MKTKFISLDQAISRAPAIAAEEPHEDVSDRYTQIKTTDVIEALQKQGWGIVSAEAQKVQTRDREGLQRHKVVFGASALTTPDGDMPTINMFNSHDRTTRYHLLGGIQVFHCWNGLLFSKATISEMRFRHQDLSIPNIINATERMGFKLRGVVDDIEGMKGKGMSGTEKTLFATEALALRYGDIKRAPVGTATILQARRKEDEADNLWKVFNRVQENIIRGGQSDKLKDANGRSLGRSQPITSIHRDTELNHGLWDLADTFMN